MKHQLVSALCALALSVTAQAATRSYDTASFEKVSVAAGIDVDITLGGSRSVEAETRAGDFDDLRIAVKGDELRIDRPARSWFWFGRRPRYSVRVVMPALRAVEASSGSSVSVKGRVAGDLALQASSGSEVEVAEVGGGNVEARSSSGSDIQVVGSCLSLDASTSSGSDLDAGRLLCERVAVQASSGSDAVVAAKRGLTAKASSGANVRVNGTPVEVQVNTSSGGHVNVRQLEK